MIKGGKREKGCASYLESGRTSKKKYTNWGVGRAYILFFLYILIFLRRTQRNKFPGGPEKRTLKPIKLSTWSSEKFMFPGKNLLFNILTQQRSSKTCLTQWEMDAPLTQGYKTHLYFILFQEALEGLNLYLMKKK